MKNITRELDHTIMHLNKYSKIEKYNIGVFKSKEENQCHYIQII